MRPCRIQRECCTAQGPEASEHVYHSNGAVVPVEVQGRRKGARGRWPKYRICIYAETGKSVKLTCADGITDFTMQDDGALTGLPDGSMARLTPMKDK